MKIKTMNLSFYILFILSVGVVFLLCYMNGDKIDKNQYVNLEIGANETVWELAEKYENKHDLTSWEFVKWVEEHNHIDADNIAVGTTVILPIEKQHENDSVIIVADGKR